MVINFCNDFCQLNPENCFNIKTIFLGIEIHIITITPSFIHNGNSYKTFDIEMTIGPVFVFWDAFNRSQTVFCLKDEYVEEKN